MVAIVAHLTIKAERLAEFEEIERDLAAKTKRNEKNCLLYECWRGAEPNKYYALLAFTDEAAFYEHQASEWHEKHAKALYECFDDVRLEFVDPVEGAGSGLPPTEKQSDYISSSEVVDKYRNEFPITVQQWWIERRQG